MGCCFGHDGQENDEVLQNLEAGSVVDVSEREEVDQSAAKSLQPSFLTHFMYVVSGFVGLLVVAALVDHFHAQQAQQDMINLVSKMESFKSLSEFKNAFPDQIVQESLDTIKPIVDAFKQACTDGLLLEDMCQEWLDTYAKQEARILEWINGVLL
eukprot:608335_1